MISTKTILITGSTGFVGSHLFHKLCNDPSFVVVVTSRSSSPIIVPGIIHHILNILDTDSLYSVLLSCCPDVVIHLASQSYVSSSWNKPEETYHTNQTGTENLFSALHRLQAETGKRTHVIIPSSSEVSKYSDNLLDEQSALLPRSPYGISKLAQEYIAQRYHDHYGITSTIMRMFNHSGPRRTPSFIDTSTAYKIALIERDLIEPHLTFRTLAAIRDFMDISDAVSAYIAAIKAPMQTGIYNVCSSKRLSLETLIASLIQLSTSHSKIKLCAHKAVPLPSDGGCLVGENKSFRASTGWEPQRDFCKDSLPQILDYWRSVVANYPA